MLAFRVMLSVARGGRGEIRSFPPAGPTLASRRSRILAGGLTAVLVCALTGLHPPSASAASCAGTACNGADPYASGCGSGATVAGDAPIVDGQGRQIGDLKLFFSPSCQTNWGQAYFSDGNPASTPPVDVTVVGSSAGSAYNQGPVDFTYTGSGSPVWGNMVYSPGCAYATVTRGDAHARTVQNGCPPPGSAAPPPPASCAATACNNGDPYASGCGSGATVAGDAPIVDGQGRQIGDLKLFFSPSCQTNWGQAYFSDGNPASTPPVDVTVVGSSAGSAYNQGPVDFTYTGSGSPVWGNMVYSPGCAYATVTRGDASAQAVQSGCAGPQPPRPTGGTCPEAPGAGDNVTRWRPVVTCVLAQLGQPVTPAYINDVFIIIAAESSGNPRAINLTDINAQRGDPSRGLMQVIGTTFQAHRSHALPDDIYDPAANIYAGLAYGIGRYGSIPGIPGVRAVNAGGGYLPYSLPVARRQALNCGAARAGALRLAVSARALTCRQARRLAVTATRSQRVLRGGRLGPVTLSRSLQLRTGHLRYRCWLQRFAVAQSVRLNGTLYIIGCVSGVHRVAWTGAPAISRKTGPPRTMKSPGRRTPA